MKAYRYNNYESFLDVSERKGIRYISSSIDSKPQFYSTQLSDIKMEEDTGYVYIISKNSGDKVYFYIKSDPTTVIGSKYSFGTTTHPNTISANANVTMIAGTKSSQGQGTGQDQSNANQSDQVWIQSGAKAKEGIFIELVDATAKGIGITDPKLNVLSYDQASTSISRLDIAINQVSTETNSMEGKLRRKNGKILSSKMEQHQHGYGLGLITVLSRKYGGEIEIKEKEGTFRILVVLNPDVVQSGI